MKLRHKRLSVNDDESATFSAGHHSKMQNSYKKLAKAVEYGEVKGQLCQVLRSCENPAVGVCSEEAYRGCTLAYCEEHSGLTNRQKRELFCCRPCGRDKHDDIC